MEPVNTKCPECKGMMEPGQITDQGYGQIYSAKWVNGKPVASIWTGRLKNEKVYSISAYRCMDCGYLKLYARDKIK